MARSSHASGTQSASVGTEHTLEDETGGEGKVYDAYIDLGNMQSGDTVEIRVYAKVVASGTLRRVYYHKYVGPQDDEGNLKSAIVYVPPLTVGKEWKLALKQTAGTGRSYDWNVYSD